MVNTINPVLNSIAVKKGIKNIQKTVLYAFLIRDSGCVKVCGTAAYFSEISRSHANRMEV